MQKRNISKDWLFSLDGGAQQRVDLPHDYVVHGRRAPENAGAHA